MKPPASMPPETISLESMSLESISLESTQIDDSPATLHFDAAPAKDTVVLLHGLFATRRSMRRIESRLESRYEVLNWGYSTLWRTTEYHVDRLMTVLADLQRSPEVRRIHFVTHSMGGILVRAALHRGYTSKVGRVVMLSPPNRGSRLTRIRLGPAAWIVPAIADLGSHASSLPNRLPTLPVPFGIIAATHDFVVHVKDTSLPNQQDHCTLPTTHTRLPQHEEAIEKIECFLMHGRFTDPQHRRAA